MNKKSITLRNRLLTLTAFCLTGFVVSTLHSQTITLPVSNYSFEDPPVEDITTGTGGTSWTVSRPTGPGSATGLVPNGVQASYPDTPFGDQYLFISGRKSNQNGIDEGLPNRVYQQVIGGIDQPIVLQDYTYTLTVSLANLTNPTNFSFGLYSDASMTQALAIRNSSTITLSNEEWRDFSVSWTATATDLGKSVYVGFSSFDFGLGATTPRLGIDNVRLTVVPEPKIYPFLILGGIALLIVRRYRLLRNC